MRQVSRCTITVILEQEHFQSFPEHWQWNVQQHQIVQQLTPVLAAKWLPDYRTFGLSSSHFGNRLSENFWDKRFSRPYFEECSNLNAKRCHLREKTCVSWCWKNCDILGCSKANVKLCFHFTPIKPMTPKATRDVVTSLVKSTWWPECDNSMPCHPLSYSYYLQLSTFLY